MKESERQTKESTTERPPGKLKKPELRLIRKREREAERQFQLEMKRSDVEAKRHEVKEVTIDDGETANRRPPEVGRTNI